MQCCCLHVKYIFKDRSLHVGSSKPAHAKNFRPVLFEILGFKLKNENDNDKKIRELDLVPYLCISHFNGPVLTIMLSTHTY